MLISIINEVSISADISFSKQSRLTNPRPGAYCCTAITTIVAELLTIAHPTMQGMETHMKHLRRPTLLESRPPMGQQTMAQARWTEAWDQKLI